MIERNIFKFNFIRDANNCIKKCSKGDCDLISEKARRSAAMPTQAGQGKTQIPPIVFRYHLTELVLMWFTNVSA